MTNENFKLFLKEMNFTIAKAALELGLSTATIDLYIKGKRFDNGKEVIIPRHIGLACSALKAGLTEYGVS